jgi:hypothetical protein
LCELRFPSYYPEPHANHFNTGVKGELWEISLKLNLSCHCRLFVPGKG